MSEKAYKSVIRIHVIRKKTLYHFSQFSCRSFVLCRFEPKKIENKAFLQKNLKRTKKIFLFFFLVFGFFKRQIVVKNA